MEPAARRAMEERSLSELLADATRESSDLIRKEIELVRLEVVGNIASLKSGVVGMAVALPLLFAGLLVLLLAAVAALDRVVGEPWLSATIVGGAVTLVGLIALAVGRRAVKRASLTPQKAVESLQEDKQMLQRHVGSTRR